MSGTMNQNLLRIAAVVLLTIAVRLPLLDIPLERDEGEYVYIAWRLNHGELPYRDWFDQKPPGVFWVYRAALSLPMDPTRAIHLMGLLFSAASGCALFFVARRWTSGNWAMLAAALFAILAADPHVQGTAANTEIFMVLPLILSQWAFLRSGPGERFETLFAVLCGVFSATAVVFKQVAGLNWPVLVVLYPLFFRGQNRA